MVAVANKVLTGALLILDIKDVFSKMKEENHDFSFAERVNLAAQAILSTIRTFSVGADVLSDDLEMRKGIKIAELISRAIILPIDLATSEANLPGNKLGAKIFTHLSGIFRTFCAANVLQEKRYLQLSPEELKTAYRVQYDPDSHVVSTRPIDPEECKFLIEAHELFIFSMNTAEFCVRTDFSAAYDQVKDFLEFCNVFRREQVRVPPPEEDVIPEEFHEDPIFAGNICPITLCPIRHPLRDPTTGTIYEARALIAWVVQHQNSPTSRRPLRERDLQPVPELEARIVERLRIYNNLN
jgi:hypothetical protein